MTGLLLVAGLGGRRIALRAAEIQSVIELDMLTPVPGAPSHIAGLSALRSRVLTVIDARKALDLPDALRGEGEADRRHAAVAEVEGHLYALQLDGVDDVVDALSEPAPLRVDLDHGWARAALGTVETENGPLLLLDVAGIVAGPGENPSVKAA
jgi:purine-binding chemotaxis protein CheW